MPTNAIVIPLNFNMNQAQRQLNALQRQVNGIQRNIPLNVGGGAAGGGNARQARQPKAPPTLGQQIKNAIMTSRIDASGRIMPLVNRLVPIFARVNPIVTGATVAIAAMTRAANEAKDVLLDFRSGQLTSGGTAGQTAALRGIGGIAGTDLNSMSREFSNRISTNGMAAGYASRAGVYDPGGEIFGDPNKAKNLLKWAEALRKMSDAEATRAARVTDTEPLLKLRDISEDVFKQMKRDALQTAQVMSPSRIRAAADFNAQLDRMNSAFDDLKVQVGSAFIPAATQAAKSIADLSRGLIAIGENPIVKWAIGAATTAASAGIGMGGQGKGIGGVINPQTKATQDNTDALKELAQQLKNGVYGGGERARSATPSRWSGMSANEWARQATRLGAF